MDLEVGFQLSISLEVSSLVGGVSVNDVGSLILEVSEGEEDNIACYYPDLPEPTERQRGVRRYSWVVTSRKTHLLPHLTPDLTQSRLTILTLGLYPTVTEHLDHLCVL